MCVTSLSLCQVRGTPEDFAQFVKIYVVTAESEIDQAGKSVSTHVTMGRSM